MCDDDIHPGTINYDAAVSRRFFNVAALAAAGLAGGAAHAADAVVGKDVNVKTADGTADAALFYPDGKGSWPAVLIFDRHLGLRPAFRDMAKRLAGQGYVVLVHNPFYRVGHAPDRPTRSSTSASRKTGPRSWTPTTARAWMRRASIATRCP